MNKPQGMKDIELLRERDFVKLFKKDFKDLDWKLSGYIEENYGEDYEDLEYLPRERKLEMVQDIAEKFPSEFDFTYLIKNFSVGGMFINKEYYWSHSSRHGWDTYYASFNRHTILYQELTNEELMSVKFREDDRSYSDGADYVSDNRDHYNSLMSILEYANVSPEFIEKHWDHIDFKRLNIEKVEKNKKMPSDSKEMLVNYKKINRKRKRMAKLKENA